MKEVKTVKSPGSVLTHRANVEGATLRDRQSAGPVFEGWIGPVVNDKRKDGVMIGGVFTPFDQRKPLTPQQLDNFLAPKGEVFFAINRRSNKAAIINVSSFEHLQMMFRVSIMLPDSSKANGIGRCKSLKDFSDKTAKGATEVMFYDSDCLEIKAHEKGSKWCKVSPRIFRSFSGNRRFFGKDYSGPIYYLGTDIISLQLKPTRLLQ